MSFPQAAEQFKEQHHDSLILEMEKSLAVHVSNAESSNSSHPGLVLLVRRNHKIILDYWLQLHGLIECKLGDNSYVLLLLLLCLLC